MAERRELAPAILVFSCVALFFGWLVGNRLVLVNDEGIYLDGAVRLLHGSRLYRDFFVITGPGTFWNLAILFKLFGVSLTVARLLLIADLALIAAGIYWLTATFRSRHLAFWVSGCYAALLSADTGSLVVNHRWDSAACSIFAVVCFVHGLQRERLWPLVLAGASCAYAAWITPPVGLISLVLFGWTLIRNSTRQSAALAGGFIGVSAIAMAALMWTGSGPSFLKALFWTASQYSGANRFAYGDVIGGYGQLFAGIHGTALLVPLFLVFFVALPAIVPILSIPLCLLCREVRRSPVLLIALCAVAAVASCYPRMDVGHLVYAAPLWYVVAACGIATVASSNTKMILVGICSLGACIFGCNAVAQRTTLVQTNVRMGKLAVEPNQLTLVSDLTRSVDKGEDFFAFPYLPIAYFLTGARNPTQYSFLQPGMMSDADEQAALDSLNRQPPSKVLYMDVPASVYLRLFPSSDPARLRMTRIEAWLDQCYEQDQEFSHAHAGYSLLIRRSGHPNSCPAPERYN